MLSTKHVQAERLNRALGNYRLAIEASSPEDRALISRAHEAMGRIYAFLGNASEAEKEFDQAIKIGDVPAEPSEMRSKARKSCRQNKQDRHSCLSPF